ncbi:MAG: hypothetical protein JO108_33285 [Acidobacteriaceae bacterium]|nr:hypothetical protein [Acidobacteriaceae bacterium]
MASPPPPDGLAPVPWFLVTGVERNSVIAQATGAAPAADVISRAVVFRIAQNDQNSFVLILSGAAAGSPVTVYRVALNPQRPPATSFNLPNEASSAISDIVRSIKLWEALARPGENGA